MAPPKGKGARKGFGSPEVSKGSKKGKSPGGKSSKSGKSPKGDGSCFNCGEHGHGQTQCPAGCLPGDNFLKKNMFTDPWVKLYSEDSPLATHLKDSDVESPSLAPPALSMSSSAGGIGAVATPKSKGLISKASPKSGSECFAMQLPPAAPEFSYDFDAELENYLQGTDSFGENQTGSRSPRRTVETERTGTSDEELPASDEDDVEGLDLEIAEETPSASIVMKLKALPKPRVMRPLTPLPQTKVDTSDMPDDTVVGDTGVDDLQGGDGEIPESNIARLFKTLPKSRPLTPLPHKNLDLSADIEMPEVETASPDDAAFDLGAMLGAVHEEANEEKSTSSIAMMLKALPKARPMTTLAPENIEISTDTKMPELETARNEDDALPSVAEQRAEEENDRAAATMAMLEALPKARPSKPVLAAPDDPSEMPELESVLPETRSVEAEEKSGKDDAVDLDDILAAASGAKKTLSSAPSVASFIRDSFEIANSEIPDEDSALGDVNEDDKVQGNSAAFAESTTASKIPTEEPHENIDVSADLRMPDLTTESRTNKQDKAHDVSLKDIHLELDDLLDIVGADAEELAVTPVESAATRRISTQTHSENLAVSSGKGMPRLKNTAYGATKQDKAQDISLTDIDLELDNLLGIVRKEEKPRADGAIAVKTLPKVRTAASSPRKKIDISALAQAGATCSAASASSPRRGKKRVLDDDTPFVDPFLEITNAREAASQAKKEEERKLAAKARRQETPAACMTADSWLAQLTSPAGLPPVCRDPYLSPHSDGEDELELERDTIEEEDTRGNGESCIDELELDEEDELELDNASEEHVPQDLGDDEMELDMDDDLELDGELDPIAQEDEGEDELELDM